MDRNRFSSILGTFTRSGDRLRGRRAAARRRPAVEGLEGRLLLTDGVLDPSFGTGGRADISFNLGQNNQDQNYAMAVQPLDGKIVLVGSARTATTGDIDAVVTRLNADGTLDTNFGTGGHILIDFDGLPGDEDAARAVAIAPDGKIVVAGYTEINGVADFDFAVARLNANGTLDTDFNGTGKQHISFNGVAGSFDLGSAVAVQADKKILIGGTAQTSATDYDFGIVRLNEDGSLDTDFDGDGKQTVAFNLGGNNMDTLNAITLSGDKVVLAGYVPRGSNGTPGTPAAYDFAVARLNANGSLDTDFDGDGKTTINVGGNNSSEAANGVAALADGRIVVVGQSIPLGGTNRSFAVTRLKDDGSLDPTFNGTGRTIIPFDLTADGRDVAWAVTLDSDNRVIVVGEAQSAAGDADMAVVRLKSNGILDPDFGTGGKQTVAFNRGGGNSDVAHGVGIQPQSGKIVLTGTVQVNSTGDYDFGAARLESSGVPANRAPVAVDDVYTTAANTPLNVLAPGILANDTDADLDTLTATQVIGPTHGLLTFNPDGSFTYTPSNGFSGQDSFTYTAGDGTAASNIATVTITVTPPPNHAPVAGNDAYEALQNTPLVIPGPGVLANDTDADIADPRIAVQTSQPAHGVVTLNPDGSFSYTPAPGYSGLDSFTYVVSDNKVASNTATVTINVRDTTPPQALFAHLVRTRTKVGRRRVTTLTLQVTFNEAMNPALASFPALYQVSEIKGTRKRVKYQAVGVTAASYDAASHTVSLTLPSKRRFNKGGQLVILPNLTDLAGNLLDGNRNGVPGVMATLLFPKG